LADDGLNFAVSAATFLQKRQHFYNICYVTKESCYVVVTSCYRNLKTMLKCKNSPNSNVVEVYVDGEVTASDFEYVVSCLEADIQKHGELRVLQVVRRFKGGNPLVLWSDAKFSLANIEKFTHAAVVTEHRWLQTFSNALSSALPATVKAFDSSCIEEARQWLTHTESMAAAPLAA